MWSDGIADKGATVAWYRLKACLKCHGDLALDQGDWICLQCGTYYYVNLYRRPLILALAPPAELRRPEQKEVEVVLPWGASPPVQVTALGAVVAVSGAGFLDAALHR